MLQYIIVFALVASAAVYVGMRLWRHIQGSPCEDCCCREKPAGNSELIQIDHLRRGKK